MSNVSSDRKTELQNAPDRGLNCDTNDDDDRHSYSGYNSDDEHHGQKYDLTHEEWEERDRLFVKTMSDRGFVIEAIMEDGACLFRAISLQIYGDQEMHEMIRQQTMDYIVSRCRPYSPIDAWRHSVASMSSLKNPVNHRKKLTELVEICF